MAAVRLGRNHLRWCDGCEMIVLETDTCPVCGKKSREIEVTPPGDVRPAFPHDIGLIKELADRQFGDGCGDALLPEGHIVLLNKAPSLDRMDEIIVDGCAIATIRYDLGLGWKLINRMQSAMRIAPVMTKGYVVCDDGAVKFVQESKNLMAPGVADAHPDIKLDDEVIVITKDKKAIATGTAKMTAQEMKESERGVAVKTKWYKPEEPRTCSRTYTWEQLVGNNRDIIEKRRDEAVAFIRKNVENAKTPAIVSFSGGKDSLTTLLLTLDAGYKLPALFVNTGLEFSETVQHVRDTAERHGIQLIEESAPTDAFFGNLVHFGPPAKDFRWCCKTNKLGPTVGAIMKNFPDGVLSFIGQRKYESEARHDKGRVWVNPWTPGQTGASPIQNWNALHVWFYLFYKKEPFNIWYTRGLDRIGCFLCPASDMSELEIVAGNSERYPQWDRYLDDYMEARGLPPEWKTFALWRWKNAPDSIRQEVQKVTGKNVSELTKQTKTPEKGPLMISVQEGYSPCVVGYSIEAALSRPVDIERLEGFAHILGKKVAIEGGGQWLTIDYLTVYREGSVISKAGAESEARKNIDRLFEIIIRSEQCVGCSLCIARCSHKALSMKDGRAEIDSSLCIGCGQCLGPCPAVNFRATETEL